MCNSSFTKRNPFVNPVNCGTCLLSPIVLSCGCEIENLPDSGAGIASAGVGESGSIVKDEPIYPLEYPTNLPQEKFLPGKSSLHDAPLSNDNSIACTHCHSIEHGGPLSVTSEGLGDGAVFRMTLPFKPASELDSGSSRIEFEKVAA